MGGGGYDYGNPRAWGDNALKKFWRQGGVKMWKPSVVWYGYFLESPISKFLDLDILFGEHYTCKNVSIGIETLFNYSKKAGKRQVTFLNTLIKSATNKKNCNIWIPNHISMTLHTCERWFLAGFTTSCDIAALLHFFAIIIRAAFACTWSSPCLFHDWTEAILDRSFC